MTGVLPVTGAHDRSSLAVRSRWPRRSCRRRWPPRSPCSPAASAGGARTCRPTSSASPSSSATGSRSGTTSGTAGTTRSGYGVLFPLLGATFGIWTVTVLSSATSAFLADLLLRQATGRRCLLASMWFAVSTVTNVAVGRLPFALGLAVALGALVAAQRRWIVAHGGADRRHRGRQPGRQRLPRPRVPGLGLVVRAAATAAGSSRCRCCRWRRCSSSPRSTPRVGRSRSAGRRCC